MDSPVRKLLAPVQVAVESGFPLVDMTMFPSKLRRLLHTTCSW